MREIDTMAISAKSDSQVREKLIQQNEFYILKCASKTCHRYITKSDDEWSVSLMAFSQAIDGYDLMKGNFLSFAALIIKRRLIDYVKTQNKYKTEIFVDPGVFDTDPEEEAEDIPIRMAVADQVSRQDSGELKLEIQAVTQVFSTYGFTFLDLSGCSPHAGKTKKACAKAVNYMFQNPLLIHDLRTSKQLPLTMIEKDSHVPRKILERHRKYIIAAIEILSGGYPNLAEYMRYIKEENEL